MSEKQTTPSNPFQPVPNPFPERVLTSSRHEPPLGGSGNEFKNRTKKDFGPVWNGNGLEGSEEGLPTQLVRAAIRAAEGADAMPSPEGSLQRARALSEVIRIGRQLRHVFEMGPT